MLHGARYRDMDGKIQVARLLRRPPLSFVLRVGVLALVASLLSFAGLATAQDPPGSQDPPSQPGNLDAQMGSSGLQVVLSWDAPAGDGATTYRIQRFSTSDGTVSLATAQTATTYTDTNVQPDTTYWYDVWATRNSLESVKASVSITTGAAAGAPDAPGNLTASEDTPGEVVLSWDAPAGDGATTYRIQRLSTSYGTVSLATAQTATTFTDTNVQPDTGYWYDVWATRNSLESVKATVVFRTGAPAGAPDAPGNLTASEETPGTVVLSWDAPAGDGDTTYRIARLSASDGTVSLATAQTGTTFTDSNVQPDTGYWYDVWATRNSLESVKATVAFRTGAAAGAPDAPGSLTASEDTPGEVVLSWDAPAGDGATTYRIQRFSVSDGTVSLATAQTATSYTDSNVQPDTDYWYDVWATRNSVESIKASVSITTGAAAGAPDPPGNLEANIGGL